eukprot:COSAG01_NODE_1641_length_9647_cov_5.299539_3_plen_146_part_00
MIHPVMFTRTRSSHGRVGCEGGCDCGCACGLEPKIILETPRGLGQDEAYKGMAPEEMVLKWVRSDFFQRCTQLMPINKSFLEKCMGDETGMEDEVIPFEVERPKTSAHHTETIPLRLESLCATLSDSFTDVPLRFYPLFTHAWLS